MGPIGAIVAFGHPSRPPGSARADDSLKSRWIGGAAAPYGAGVPVPELTATQLRAMLAGGERPLLLDVRSHGEHLTVALPGSMLVPLPELAERMDEVREEGGGRGVVAYCHHGVRSRSAAALLLSSGFSAVWSLRGGIDAWAVQVEPGMPRY